MKMNIGLIGQALFQKSYKKAFKSYAHEISFAECTLEDAADDREKYGAVLEQSPYLFFEKINSQNYHLIIAALRNGRHVFVDNADMQLSELEEIYKIAHEANLRCVQFPDEHYYFLLKPILSQHHKSQYLEIEWETGEKRKLSNNENLVYCINYCMKNLFFFLKGEMNHCIVKTYHVLSEAKDLVNIFLEFSNGRSAFIKLSSLSKSSNHVMKIYQQQNVHTISLSASGISLSDKKGILTENENLEPLKRDIFEKKAEHFYELINSSESQAHSMLDDYLAMEMAARIIKKTI